MNQGLSVANQRKDQRSPLHFSVVAIEKGAFGSPSTMAANFLLIQKRKHRLNVAINFLPFLSS